MPQMTFIYQALGGIHALRAHCALLLDYVPPEEPTGTPLGNALKMRRPKLDWSPVRLDAQIVALRAHCAKGAPLALLWRA